MGEAEREKARQKTLVQLAPPRRIPGYERERFLGRGAFGEVWVAVDSNNGRKVAIKFYHRRGGLDWSLLSREVEKLRYLFGDRHVVQLLAVGWDSDPPYYVMEYMESGSLDDLLRSGPLPADRAVELTRGIAVGLVHAHGKGVLHCDLKPGNVMLDQDGQPRLADFGQSRLSHEHAPALGTLFYMAPEQADLKANPDARWDVYALGAVLYRMLTGDAPFRTPDILAEVQQSGPLADRLDRYRNVLAAAARPVAHKSVPGVDSELAAIIDRCLAVNPHNRYPNPQAVLSALDARAAHRARRPLLILGVAGPLLVLLIILGVAGYEASRMIGMAAEEEVGRARDLNRMAARAAADRLGWEVAARWQLLEQEAADPRLKRGFNGDWKRPAMEELSRWLTDRQEYWGRRGGAALRGTNWVALDRDGYIRGCTEPDPDHPGRSRPMPEVLGMYFGFRDYFHSRGQDMPRSEAPPPTDPPRPLRRPYRSAAFQQLPQRTFAVAYAAPIFGSGRDPEGVLVAINDLLGSTRLKTEDGRDRFVVLADTGRTNAGQSGLILRHPYQDDFTDRPTEMPTVFAPWLVEKKGGYDGPYIDPVGEMDEPWAKRFAGRWIAGVEPVRIPVAPTPDAPSELTDTGWVVVVQEAEAGVVAPVQTLQQRLVARGVITLSLIAALLGGLWLFVLVVMNAAPGSRIVQYLRRKSGLKSGLSAASSASSRTDHPSAAPPSANAEPPSKRDP